MATALRYNPISKSTKEQAGVTEVYRVANDADPKANIKQPAFGKSKKKEKVVCMGQISAKRGAKTFQASAYVNGSTKPTKTLTKVSGPKGPITTKSQAVNAIWRNYDTLHSGPSYRMALKSGFDPK